MRVRIALLVLWLAVGAVSLRALQRQERVPARQPLASIPTVLGDWRLQRDVQFDAETLAVLKPDDYISRSYIRDEGRQVSVADLYVGFYQTQRRGDTIHSPMNCLPGTGWQPVSTSRVLLTPAPGVSIDANRYIVQKGLDKRLVVYWYQSHGRSLASEYWSKAYLMWDAIRLNRTDGALVRVIAPLEPRPGSTVSREPAIAEFVRAVYPALHRVLPE
jgi:EpsI family protein